MIMDLETFPHEQSGRIASLIDAGDLDKYTYLVAGCVGEFWTLVCAEHEPQCRAWHLEIQQQERGIRLGKALQLTNILRDVAQDLRIGRCYLPLTQLHKLQLNPEDLLDLNSAAQAKPILDDWLVIALNHYEAGSDYAMAIPKRAIRLRLAVFWPMLIGLATLSKLANNPDWLSPAAPIKVSRRWVYKMMLMSLPCIASNRIMAGWLKRLQSEVKAQLHETHRHSLPH
jgi:farnesyl-diphosphate farnesyltransferase